MKAFTGILLVLLSIPLPLAAEMPSLESLAQRRYVIRNGGYYTNDRTWRAEGGSGIWDWNFETGELTRIRPLGTQLMIGSYTDATIVGLEDRYVVHHYSTLEFDAATNRFLRRYDGLAPEHGQWVLRGTAVTETASKKHGLAAGYYGSVGCPGYDPGPSCVGEFPGVGLPVTYQSQAILAPFLFHRPLEPADGQLRLAKFFGPSLRPAVSFDPKRGRFWFQSVEWKTPPAVTNVIVRLGYLPVENGLIQDPVVLDTWEASVAYPPRGIVYDPSTDSLVGAPSPDGDPTRRPADLSRGPEPLPSGFAPFATLSGETPASYEQVVPAVGKGPGAHGTSWRSDVWFFNPSSTSITFTVRRVSRPGVSTSFELPAHGSMELIDVLAGLGGGPESDGGDGINTDGLVIESPYRWGEQLTVYSRTYTSDPQGEGTYGQSVPAVPSRYGYANNGSFVLDRREPGQYRHNLGVVNDAATPLIVSIMSGGHAETVSIAPHTVANLNLETLPSIWPCTVCSADVETERPVPVWLSMIDNKTGDGTFVPFSNFALEGALDAAMAIPQIASISGAHGTRWRSDLYGEMNVPAFEFTPSSASLLTNFYPADPAFCGGLRSIAQKVPITNSLVPDIAQLVGPCSAGQVRGALELHTGSWTAAYSRTYTTREDGGTLGDILPLYPFGGWPVQHFSGIRIRDGFRINLGLYNGLDHDVVHRLIVYAADGTEVTRRDLTLAPRQSLQSLLSDFIGPVSNGLYGLTVLPLDQPDRPGRSWAYVSIIDNATGDPTNLW